MKKTILLMSLFLLTSIMTFAVPALPGIWRNITLEDGTTVYAQLKGDETVNFYEDKEGNIYMANEDGTYSLTSADTFKKKASKRRAKFSAISHTSSKRVAGVGNKFFGSKRCLILLAEFPNKKFKDGHDNAFYTDMMNKEGFSTSDGFVGSVKDYFLAQSDGRFDLTFDVKGPYMMPSNYEYYGNNYEEKTVDVVNECLKQAHNEGVNMAQYDWYNSGDVDLVYVLYAGYGQATSTDKSSIWPHASRRTTAFAEYDGKKLKQYACSNEIDQIKDNNPNANLISGIGTICHEFSHCLGFPDYYDVDYSGAYGMGSWDIMSSGSYNENSFRPANYTAYEKWVAGWLTPVELGSEDKQIDNVKPTSQGGNAYIMYNDAHRNEFYIMENRQRTGWDAALAANGLLITHVDYDEDVWNMNKPNDDPGHQRCTIAPADGTLSKYTEQGDCFPYGSRNKFVYTSSPKPFLYNQNTDGTFMLTHGLTDIKRNSDGTVSFMFLSNTKPAEPTTKTETVMHESFDKCKGRGGMGAWGSQTSSAFNTDLKGWTLGLDAHAYGGNKCALFGQKNYNPTFTSPSFTLNGDKATITINVAPFANDKGTTLKVNLGDKLEKEFTMKKSQWNTFTIETTLNGTFKLSFTAQDEVSRLWFDDLLIEQTVTLTGIENVVTDKANVRPADNRIFTVNGVYVGTDASSLPKGIYIMNGKKFVK